jgi:ABC-2 type transport system ATP-binding protein
MPSQRGEAMVELEGVSKVYPGIERTLRGTKLEWQGPALWIRNALRAARLVAENSSPVTALQEVTLEIGHGEVFGLVGPNGSGKTTLIKILAGLVRPSSGYGRVAGCALDQPAEIRRRVSYVSTTGWMGLEWALNAEENLRFFAALTGMPRRLVTVRVAEALQAVGLWEDRQKLVSSLSNGMRQRLILARGLLLHTPLVLLDEPLVGLDPEHRDQIINLVRRVLPERGQTVVIADHQADAIERVVDRVAILGQGRVQGLGTLTELVGRLEGLTVLEMTTEWMDYPTSAFPAVVRRAERTPRAGPLGLVRWRLTVERGDDTFSQVLEWLERMGARIVEVEERRPGLQDLLDSGMVAL